MLQRVSAGIEDVGVQGEGEGFADLVELLARALSGRQHFQIERQYHALKGGIQQDIRESLRDLLFLKLLDVFRQ